MQERNDRAWPPATRNLLRNAKLSNADTYRQKLSQRVCDLEQEIRDQRAECERRVGALKLEISALRSCHNSLTPIQTLPAEVLSAIFRFYANKYPWNDRDGRPMHWIKVSHVCKHWREVALDCADLWTDLSFVHPNLTELMLDRSKNAPLRFRPPPRRQMESFGSLFVKLSSQRNRMVKVDMQWNPDLSAQQSISWVFDNTTWSVPLPVLEHLRLCGLDGRRLPDNFLQCGAPSLRSLSLDALIPNWSTLPPLPFLTDLCLDLAHDSRNMYPQPRPRPSPQEFQAFLGSLRRLQTLRLVNSLPNSPFDPASALSFAGVQKLELDDDATSVMNFLSIAQFGHRAKFNLIIKNQDEELPVRPLIPMVIEKMERAKSPMLALDLAILESYPYLTNHLMSCSFADVSSTTTQTEYSPFRPEADLSLKFVHGVSSTPQFTTPFSLINVLKTYVDFTPLAHLNCLGARWGSQLNATQWRDGFGRLPNLRTVNIMGGSNLRSFMAMLKQPFIDEHGPSFPALERLIVDTDDLVPKAAVVPKLASFLRARHGQGAPLRCLKLRGPTISDSHLRILRNAFPGIELIENLHYCDYPDSDPEDVADLSERGRYEFDTDSDEERRRAGFYDEDDDDEYD